MSSFKKIKKASKYADCKNSGKGSLLKYYGVKTERRGFVFAVFAAIILSHYHYLLIEHFCYNPSISTLCENILREIVKILFFYYEQAKINLAEIFKKKIILLLFFSFYIIIWVVKRIYPSKNFFYIITPYLIIYTPLEMLCSSPAEHFSFVY